MPINEKFTTNLQKVSNIISATSVVIVTTLLFSKKEVVFDFLYHSFKNIWAFLGFSVSFMVMIWTFSIIIKEVKLPPLNPSKEDQAIVKKNKRQRENLARLKKAFLLIAVILFGYLLYSQFTNKEFGILQGDTGDNDFANGVLGVMHREKPRNFVAKSDIKINYASIDDTSYVRDRFSFEFNNGAVYTTQWNQQKKVINIKIKWIGKSRCYSDSVYSRKEFGNLNILLNDDVPMVSKFILGFIYLHLCDTGRAFTYFKDLESEVQSNPDSSKKIILQPLLQWITTVKEAARHPKEIYRLNAVPESYEVMPDSLIKKYVKTIQIDKKSIAFNDFFSSFDAFPLYVYEKADSIFISIPEKEQYHVWYPYAVSYSERTNSKVVWGARAKIDTISKNQYESFINSRFKGYRRFKILQFPSINVE